MNLSDKKVILCLWTWKTKPSNIVQCCYFKQTQASLLQRKHTTLNEIGFTISFPNLHSQDTNVIWQSYELLEMLYKTLYIFFLDTHTNTHTNMYGYPHEKRSLTLRFSRVNKTQMIGNWFFESKNQTWVQCGILVILAPGSQRQRGWWDWEQAGEARLHNEIFSQKQNKTKQPTRFIHEATKQQMYPIAHIYVLTLAVDGTYDPLFVP
jgi:hypothetical protein